MVIGCLFFFRLHNQGLSWLVGFDQLRKGLSEGGSWGLNRLIVGFVVKSGQGLGLVELLGHRFGKHYSFLRLACKRL